MRRATALALTATLALGLTVAATVAPAGASVKKIDAGGYTSCAIVGNSTVKCWGSDGGGALGYGGGGSSSVPVSVTGLTNVKQISTSESPCALRQVGTVWCWGYGSSGEIGNGLNDSQNTPTQVSGITDATAISSGYEHSCAVLSTGRIKCWGDNSYGQLGNGDNGTTSNTPVTVSGINNAVQVDAGNEYHTCAKLSTGLVKCWGYNLYGQLGDNSNDDSGVPVSVVGLGQVRRVVTGYFETCAIMPDRRVKCWGQNEKGELGLGFIGGTFDTPQDVVNLSGVVALSQEDDTACAVLGTGKVKCWGDNNPGTFGDGTNDSSDHPVIIPTVSNVKSVSAGWYHTCVQLISGGVKCTGEGTSGELGNGVFDNSNTYVTTQI